MKKVRTAVVSIAALTALTIAGVATAAYSSAKLSVSYPVGATRIVASSDVADDATARAAIIVSEGTTLDISAAPNTKVGTVKAQVSALALGGALLPLSGDILVAAPGTVPAASQTGCIGALPPTATYLLVLQAAGQTLNVPAYITPVDAALGALGSMQLVFCLPPADIPVDKGGATFGAKFLSADMTFTGVFSQSTTALWTSLWTPWQVGTGLINTAGTVTAASAVLPATVSLKGKRTAGRVTLTGQVSQSGIVAPFRVVIWGAKGKAALRPIKTLVTSNKGAYKFTLSKSAKQTVFQARSIDVEATATGEDAKADCVSVLPTGLPLPPCSSFTISGFTAKSKVVTVR